MPQPIEPSEGAPASAIRFGACSDVGRVRAVNEDAYGQFLPSGGPGGERLLIVADGMGGHRRGREASTMALRVVSETYFREGVTEANVERRLQQAFWTANTRIYEQARNGSPTEKMGTTCTALALANGQTFVAHVGDSRAYRLQGPLLDQLTCDHTAVAEMEREGLLTKTQAQGHPRRHVLVRAMGIGPTLEVEIARLETSQPGDRFLLCSDGLLGVPESEIIEVASARPPQEACEELVRRANARGGHDNVTVLLVALS